jgi:site-specific DNA recombinase
VRAEHVYCDGLGSRASGEELYQRPALDRLRADAKRGAFAVVYINTVERLARDPIHSGIVLMELAEAGVAVTFVAEPLRLDTLEGQVLTFMKAYAGKMENERKRERQMRAIQARAGKGLPIRGCRAPYGFAWGPEIDSRGRPIYERLVFDPVTAPIRRRLFSEIARARSPAAARCAVWRGS